MGDPSRAVAITGIGVASPYGLGLGLLEAGLLAPECRLGPLASFSPGFAASVAEYPGSLPDARELGRKLSRSDRLAIAAARDAVGAAGADSMRECGVVMATTVAGLSELEPRMVVDPAAWYAAGGLEGAASYPVASVVEAVGDAVGACGPRCAVNVACASGAIAIALAAQMCLDGAAPAMLAGGSDALCPFTLSGFHALQALDEEPCRPFDVGRRGLNIGEGAAVLRLETLARARARNAPVLAVLRGWAMTNDGYHLTAPHERGRGLAACMLEAMRVSATGPEEIGYVNAHGTGTPLNDIAEARAYTAAFSGRRRPVPVSSTKSYFGHCLGAAGALEAAVTMIALRRGALFPTLRLANPLECPQVDWVMGGVRRKALPAAMSVSAGFGGSNAALVFAEYRA